MFAGSLNFRFLETAFSRGPWSSLSSLNFPFQSPASSLSFYLHSCGLDWILLRGTPPSMTSPLNLHVPYRTRPLLDPFQFSPPLCLGALFRQGTSFLDAFQFLQLPKPDCMPSVTVLLYGCYPLWPGFPELFSFPLPPPHSRPPPTSCDPPMATCVRLLATTCGEWEVRLESAGFSAVLPSHPLRLISYQVVSGEVHYSPHRCGRGDRSED